MIIGVGMDIVEINRVKKAIEKESFVKRVFTVREAEYCRSRGKQQAASFAARFAAKEAVSKALGSGLAGGSLNEIEIFNKEGGQPGVLLHGRFFELAEKMHVKGIHISLTHAEEYAAAQVVLSDD